MKTGLLFFGIILVSRGWAALNVPLTTQEALYPGDPTGTTYNGPGGVTRTNEPFCMGVPIAESAGIVNAQSLTLAGASAAQFRALGAWPSGKLKWVKVCGVLPSLARGQTATVTLQDGAGNFPAGNLASVSGSTITINTTGGVCGQGSAICFTVKAAGNFNLINSAAIGATPIVSASTAANRGLVLMGPNPTAPYPANVTCGTGAGQSPCTTLYSSVNDPASSCLIEENGPVMATLRCIGTHYDAAQHPYMQFTARLGFFKDQSYVKLTSILRNANYDGAIDSNGKTFNSAFKGLQSYEVRIPIALSGSTNYTIAADSTACTGGVCTGSLSPSDSAYIYQGYSTLMIQQTDCNPTCTGSFTKDVGYVAKKNAATFASNTDGTKTPAAFYADVANPQGVGIEIGVYQGGASWPKSLEFVNGGSEARIGIWPAQNSQPVYQSWPSWSITDVYLNFHASNPASLANAFLKLQHPLLLRAGVNYYNSTGVFPYPMPDPAQEDDFYKQTWAAATSADGSRPLVAASCCTVELGTQNTSIWPLTFYHYKFWPDSGPSNQEEFRWSNLLRFLRAGQTGRFLEAAHFYRMEAGNSWPHADGTSASDSKVNGFHWRDQSRLDGFGRPAIACGGVAPGDNCSTIANADKSFVDWFDQLHFHWYGILDYYFLTGDETFREAVMPVKDWYMNNNTYQGGAAGGLAIIRAIGIEMLSAGRFADFLTAIGDPDAPAVLAQGVSNYNQFVKPDICMNGYPAGCTMPALSPATAPTTPDPAGISRVRGAMGSTFGRGTGRCGQSPSRQYRATATFYGSLVVEGLLALRKGMGSNWSEYNNTFDLAYGLSQWALAEVFSDDGQSYFYKGGGVNGTPANQTLYNGFRYSQAYDVPHACPAGTPVVAGTTAQFDPSGPVFDVLQLPLPMQGMFMYFHIQRLMNGALSADQLRQFRIALDWIRAQQGQSAADLGQYQPATIIAALTAPQSVALKDVPFTVQSLGAGKYRLAWTVPAGVQLSMAPSPYRIKWSPKIIAPSTAGTFPGFGKVNGLLNYDAVVAGTFGLSPDTYATWFGANSVSEPISLPPSQTQSFDIDTGGAAGLTGPNFSVKAYVLAAPAGPATRLLISGYPANAAAGASYPVAVSALDANNALAAGYTGTVRFSSSDPAAVLPANYTFVAADAGTHTFTVKLNTAGTGRSITVTDTATASITGTQTGIAVTATASPATHFSVTGYPSPATAGAARAVVVTALDANNAVASGYTGTVRISSSDAGAVLPALYSFQASDAGAHSFSVTLNTVGTGRSITATDTTTAAITGSQANIQVTAAAGAAPTTITAVSGANQQGVVQPSGITWTPQAANASYPGLTGYSNIYFDPASSTVIVPAVPRGSGSIYASQWHSYNPATNTFTLINGDGTSAGFLGCSPNKPNQPGNRHPYWQLAVDPNRKWFWLSNGANQGCNGYTVNTAGTLVTHVGTNNQFYSAFAGEKVIINGVTYTVASVTDSTRLVLTTPAPALTNTLLQIASRVSGRDLYHMTLNATLANNTWVQHTPANFAPSVVGAMMAFDSANDVLFYYGGGADHHTVYCPSSGALTAAQTQAGCTVANDFIDIKPQNGIASINGTAITRVSGDTFTDILSAGDYIRIFDGFYQVASITDGDHLTVTSSGGVRANQAWFVQPGSVSGAALVFDPQTQNIYLYGGTNQSTSIVYNQIWAYSVAARKWSRKALSSTPPPTESNSSGFPQPAFSCTSNGLCYYHQATGVGSPQDFLYKTVSDSWSKLGSSGGGEKNIYGAQMVYAPSCNCLISYANAGSGVGSAPSMWIGTLTSGMTGQPLSSPFVVKVTGAGGSPVSGVAVTFTVTGGGGTLSGGLSTVVVNTDAQGLASITLTVGPVPGVNTVTATAGSLSGSPITFTATSATTAISRCDLNADGMTNVVDVQLGILQTTNSKPCTTADLNGDASCTLADVQRIIAASLGAACQTGQ